MARPTVPPTLESLIARARAAHESIQREPAAALERAFEAGDILLYSKGRVARGAWGGFLRQTTIPPSTARLYMQLARDRARILAAGCTSIRQARRLLAGTRPRSTRRASGARGGRHARAGESIDRYEEGYADGYRAGRADGMATATAARARGRSPGDGTAPPAERDLKWLIKIAHPDMHHEDDQTILRAHRITVWLNDLLERVRQAA